MTKNNIHLSQNSVFFIFLRTHHILLWEWNLTFYNPNVSMSIQSKLELLIEFLCFWPGKDLILRNFLKIPMCRKGNVICVSIQQLYVISMQVTGLLGSYLHGLFCICLHFLLASIVLIYIIMRFHLNVNRFEFEGKLTTFDLNLTLSTSHFNSFF